VKPIPDNDGLPEAMRVPVLVFNDGMFITLRNQPIPICCWLSPSQPQGEVNNDCRGVHGHSFELMPPDSLALKDAPTTLSV
jgi:hypothetical protein